VGFQPSAWDVLLWFGMHTLNSVTQIAMLVLSGRGGNQNSGTIADWG
jgi:hypothetical protein